MTAPSLARKTFTISRLAEFASTAELAKATGHPVERWPLVIVKELIDNALDAAEGGEGRAGDRGRRRQATAIAVADRGPGIAPETVASRRRLHRPHVEPRGLRQPDPRRAGQRAADHPRHGLRARFAAFGHRRAGRFAGEHSRPDGRRGDGAHRRCRRKRCRRKRWERPDREPWRRPPHRLRRRPGAADAGRQPRSGAVRGKNRHNDHGALARLAGPIVAAAEDDFFELVSTFVWLNPHLTLSAEFLGSERFHQEATDFGWKKWRPDLPTSPHWYNDERLNRLMTAEIAHAEDNGTACPSVRDFISQFRGLSGSAKANAICKKIGVAERLSLADFYKQQGTNAATLLLSAMRSRSRPADPAIHLLRLPGERLAEGF